MKLHLWISAELELPEALVGQLPGREKDAVETAQRVAKEALERVFTKCDRVKIETTAHADAP